MSSQPIVGLVGHGVTGSRIAGHLLGKSVRVAVYDLSLIHISEPTRPY
mgnify:CR=1 FL=1